MSGCDCLNTCSFSPCKLQTAVMVGILAINCRVGRDGGGDKGGRKLISALPSESVSFLASEEGKWLWKKMLGKKEGSLSASPFRQNKTKRASHPHPRKGKQREQARRAKLPDSRLLNKVCMGGSQVGSVGVRALQPGRLSQNPGSKTAKWLRGCGVLCLGFLVCKMGLLTAPTSLRYVDRSNSYQSVRNSVGTKHDCQLILSIISYRFF